MLEELKDLMKKYNASINIEYDTCCGSVDDQSYRIELSWTNNNGDKQICEFPYGFDENDLL